MAIQEGRRGRETEHFVLAARPLFNFFSQKPNTNMERFYGEIHQQTEAVLKNPSTVAHSRFSTCGLILMINPSVCFVVVVVLSIYQVMWTISSAIQSFMLGVFSGLHNLHSYPALVTFSVSVWFENETQKISSVLTSSEAWMQCTRNTAALSFWKCTEEAKILLQTILSYARYNLNHPFIYLKKLFPVNLLLQIFSF